MFWKKSHPLKKNVYENTNPASPAKIQPYGRVEHIFFVNPWSIRGQLFPELQKGMISVTAENLAITIEVNFYALLCALLDGLFNSMLTIFIYSVTLYARLRASTRILLGDQHTQRENAPSRESASFFSYS